MAKIEDAGAEGVTARSLGPQASSFHVSIDGELSVEQNDSVGLTNANHWNRVRRAVRERDRSGTHHIVFEAGFVAAPGFLDLMEFVILAAPSSVISFCDAPSSARDVAINQGVSWVSTDCVESIKAVVFPSEMIDVWIAWADYHFRSDFNDPAARLEAYLIASGEKMRYLVPELVGESSPAMIDPGVVEQIQKTADYAIQYNRLCTLVSILGGLKR